MLDGWTRSAEYGSSPMRPASTSALMSRSESNTARLYPARQRLAAARDLQPMITNGDDRAFADPDQLPSLATRRHAIRCRDSRPIGGSPVTDVNTVAVHPYRQMGLGARRRRIGDL